MSKHSSHGKNHNQGDHPAGENTKPEHEEQQTGTAEASPQQPEKTGETGAVSADDRIAELEAELADSKDQYLRKAAEFENFRKRMTREKQDAIDYANQSLLLDLIPIIDDFERAIKSSATSKDFDSFYEGVTMIEKRLISQLENKWGLVRFESQSQPFDPEKHEAIMMDKSPDIDEPVVEEDFLKGYTLKGRVIRSAKVKVLMPENPKPAGSSESNDSGDAPKG
ncbi:nucleotide exchange factor GrpE [Breznakiella homolactica]|uniref:Protein GrpE n=1 Tax=Breznakiella homolactica TaxID=2798577 RepID=A0A7T7XP64_9SPIR|nr:nucleotide exchange factor GrpE [Breznakiella homolactica]QQO09838.1 nucleotide exchange factor GrpE [Breznakiella homolactica]